MPENNTMENVNDVRLEAATTDILHQAKIPANIKGYHYLRTAIMLSVKYPAMMMCITKELYPTVAERYQTTSSRVERSIRHAIETAWERGAQKSLSNSLSYEIAADKDKPTNSEFIAAIADHLWLKLKTKRGDNNAQAETDTAKGV